MSGESLKWVKGSGKGWNLIEELPDDNYRIWGHLCDFGARQYSGSAHGVHEGETAVVPIKSFRGNDAEALRAQIKVEAKRHFAAYRKARKQRASAGSKRRSRK